MKRSIFKAIICVSFFLVSGYGVYISQQKVKMSDLAMENVEALADNEIIDQCQGCASYYLGRKCCVLMWPGHLETITLYYNYR